MSTSDFIREMSEEGQKVSSGGQGVVGRVLLEFGVHSYVDGHGYWDFWTATKGSKDIPVAAAELLQKVKEAEGKNRVNFGLRVTLFKDVLGKEHYKGDLVEFIPKWQEDAYDLVCAAVDENGLVFNKVFYGQIQFKANPYHVSQGEAGKTKTDQSGNPAYPTIKVPVQKFASKDEAQAFVDGNMPANGPVLPFSKTALSNYGNDVSNILAQAEEIGKHIWQAYQGKDAIGDENNPLPELKLTPPQKALVKKSTDGSDFLSLDALIIPDSLKDQIANLWMMEITDIDLIQQEKTEPPF